MACRVGMSTTPYLRIQHWKDTEGHTYGKVLHENLTHKQALKKEKEEAEARGCFAWPGGNDDGSSDWAVYYVSGGTIK